MKARLLFILGCWILTFPMMVKAQIINIDKSDTADYRKESQFNVNLSSGLEVDKQLITLYDATNTAECKLQKNKDLFIFAASYRFTYNGPDDILNAGYFHLRSRHHYKDKFQPESFLQYQWDNKRGMEYRAIGGANLRYNLWKQDNWEFNAGLGLFYEMEKWNYDGVDSTKIPINHATISSNLIKLNSYIRWDWKPSPNSDIAVNIFLQTRPDRFQPRIAPHVQWNIDAGKHVGFSISYSGMYDQSPLVPIPHFYYSLSNSLVFKF